MNLIEFTEKGIYCPVGKFHIDPWKPVSRALITHGHSDHARFGHTHYLCSQKSVPILKHRLGHSINIKGISNREKLSINGVIVSFHPAGHIFGSSQIRVEYRGEIWVIAGDYKLKEDGISEPFEPVPCHHFVTETTFGLPIYNWPEASQVFDQMNSWWSSNKEEGKVSVVGVYSLGKAQRVLQGLDDSIGKIYAHGAVQNLNELFLEIGVNLKKTIRLDAGIKKEKLAGCLVLAPPASLGTNWMNHFKSSSTALASGWMAIRGTRRRRATDRGFVLSDHCDWSELHQAIEATKAQNIYATHGYTSIFAQWLSEKGYNAQEITTEFHGDSLEEGE